MIDLDDDDDDDANLRKEGSTLFFLEDDLGGFFQRRLSRLWAEGAVQLVLLLLHGGSEGQEGGRNVGPRCSKQHAHVHVLFFPERPMTLK